MKPHVKDELGGAAFVIALSSLFWLALVVLSGCSPALPNAPNAQPTRIVVRTSHDSDRAFEPGSIPCIVMQPPIGQHFDTTASVRTKLQWRSKSDLYKWEGYTCTRIGALLLGTAAGYYPEAGAGVIVVRLTADSATVWGDISTYEPAPEELTFYEVEVQVGSLLVRNDVRPVSRLSPITCRGTLRGCTVLGECALEPLEITEYWPQPVPAVWEAQ